MQSGFSGEDSGKTHYLHAPGTASKTGLDRFLVMMSEKHNKFNVILQKSGAF
jgi:hypothetical protein